MNEAKMPPPDRAQKSLPKMPPPDRAQKSLPSLDMFNKKKPTVEAQSFPPIDLSHLSSSNELECYGMDHLKFELSQLGLKCGGTLKERASRLFLLKEIAIEDIPRKHFPKSKKRKGPAAC
jgi:hypothetical protein